MLAGSGRHGSQDSCHLRPVMVITQTLAYRTHFQWDITCVAWVTYFMCHMRVPCVLERNSESKARRRILVFVVMPGQRSRCSPMWHGRGRQETAPMNISERYILQDLRNALLKSKICVFLKYEKYSFPKQRNMVYRTGDEDDPVVLAWHGRGRQEAAATSPLRLPPSPGK